MATDTSDYSLWKATKSIYRQTSFSSAIRTKEGNWAKTDLERANTFADHLCEVFTPFPREVSNDYESFIVSNSSNKNAQFPVQQIKPITKPELRVAISRL